MEARPYYVPGVEPEAFVERSYGSPGACVVLRLPKVSPGLLRQAAHEIVAAREAHLARMPVDHIVDAIDAAVELWLDPGYRLRQVAEESLPKVTGYSQAMIREGLPLLLEPFRRPGLEALLAAEVGDATVLDEPQKPRSWARGPRLTTHILAGNIPAVAAETIVRALLVKSASLVKSSSRDPLFPALFAQSIAEVDPQIGMAIGVLWWKGGSPGLDEAALNPADAIIAYGNEQAIEQVRRLAKPGVPFVEHGPRISFAAVGREALAGDGLPDLADRVAWDVSLFDQQGCMAPHAVYVERGGNWPPSDFAAALAEAMGRMEKRLPPGRVAPEAAAAIQQIRGVYEVRRAAGEAVALFASHGSTAWTVSYEENPGTLQPSCLNRMVRVIAIDDLSLAAGAARPMARYLQTAGLACSEDRVPGLTRQLLEAGVTRVCAVGRMQHPPASWRHDGHPNLLPLLRWVDVEG